MLSSVASVTVRIAACAGDANATKSARPSPIAPSVRALVAILLLLPIGNTVPPAEHRCKGVFWSGLIGCLRGRGTPDQLSLRLRRRGRVRRRLPRGDPADRSGRAADRPHPRDRAPGDPARGAGPRERASLHAARGPPRRRRSRGRDRPPPGRGDDDGGGPLPGRPRQRPARPRDRALRRRGASDRHLALARSGSSRSRRPSTAATCSRRSRPTSRSARGSTRRARSSSPPSCRRSTCPSAEAGDGSLLAHCLYADRYGNVGARRVAASRPRRPGWRRAAGSTCAPPTAASRRVWTSTFADVREGDVLLYEDSSRRAGARRSTTAAPRACST